jgi:hypothetical protein
MDRKFYRLDPSIAEHILVVNACFLSTIKPSLPPYLGAVLLESGSPTDALALLVVWPDLNWLVNIVNIITRSVGVHKGMN